jgi:hypothetical protein
MVYYTYALNSGDRVKKAAADRASHPERYLVHVDMYASIRHPHAYENNT